MNILKIYKDKIEEIKSNTSALSIILVGSAVNTRDEDFDKLKDIDMFIITNDNSFQREVVNIDNIEFDISYMPKNLLKIGIEEKWPFLINALSKYKIIYNKIDDMELLLEKISYIYKKGPDSMDRQEVDYIRFNLFQKFEDMMVRREDEVNFQFLVHSLLNDILIAYLKINNIWIPKDKKILAVIKKNDNDLYNMCKNFILEYKQDRKIILLDKILSYVLMPVGGRLKYWEKGNFPLK
ncbi:hypothetical protein [Dethiothermospora halolimnae]|uniref:hypothetical protein n=1 Tax=Dethiothermospora halolimnae TaxID=3114390 RepID=UPI003CCC0FB1